MQRPLAIVPLAFLAVPLFGQAAPTLVPGPEDRASWAATLDTRTGELSAPALVAHPDAIHVGLNPGIVLNLDNTLEPASGPHVALLAPDLALVDWGSVRADGRAEIKSVTIAYGADVEEPDLWFGLGPGYEGYGTLDLGLSTTAIALGDDPSVQEFGEGIYYLTNIPGDSDTPGDGQVVIHELTLTLDPPIPVARDPFGGSGALLASRVEDHCIGWLYGTTTGGIGPVLVDTQCVPGIVGPNSLDYEIAMTEFRPHDGFLSPIGDFETVGESASTVGSLVTAVSFESHFAYGGERVERFYVQDDGVIGLQSALFEDIGCGLDPGFSCEEFADGAEFGLPIGESPCAWFAPFWAQFRNTVFEVNDALAVGMQPGLYIGESADRFVVRYEQVRFEGVVVEGVGEIDLSDPVTFEVHFYFCGNRVEFHYLTDVEAPEFHGAMASFVGLLSPSNFTDGTDDLTFLCDGLVSAGTAIAITRGPLPVDNGVTNKLDQAALQFPQEDIVLLGTEQGPSVQPSYLNTIDFDSSGQGPVASLFLDAKLGLRCGEADIDQLLPPELHLGLPQVEVLLEATGRPEFGATEQFVVRPAGPLLSGYGAVALALTEPAAPTPNPYGGVNPLWVDLDKILFFGVEPLAIVTPEEGPDQMIQFGDGPQPFLGALFPAEVPEFDIALCGSMWHVQAGLIGPGLNPVLSNGLQLILGSNLEDPE